MEFNKPVSNPMMVGSIELLKAEDTPEHRQMFLDELQKAKFLSPVVIDPVPVPDENGRVTIARDAKVQFPMLSTEDGRKFFMAFTDYHFSGHHDVATEGIDHESQRRADIALCIFAQQHSCIIVKVHGESLLILLISPPF